MATSPNAAQQIIRRTYSPSLTVGHVYARVYGTDAKPMPVGNVLALALEHTEDTQTQPDLTQLGGGVHAEVRRVTAVGVSMTLADINIVNLARAVLGTTAGIEAGAVAGEEHANVARGGLLRLAHIGPTGVVVAKTAAAPATIADEPHAGVDKGDLVVLANAPASVTAVKIGADLATATPLAAADNYTVVATGIQIDAAAPGVANGSTLWVTYTTAGTATPITPVGNYEVRPEGVFVFEGAADIADGDTLYINYQYGAYATIDALTQKAVELELIFGGLNEADSGKPVMVEIWRASQGITSALTLLQESGFSSLEVTGSVLQDPRKSGAGVSKYYRVSKT